MCNEEYAGERLPAVRLWKKEHRDAICLVQCKKSVLAEHVHSQSTAHQIDWKFRELLTEMKEQSSAE